MIYSVYLDLHFLKGL